jgi:hypothetical protein
MVFGNVRGGYYRRACDEQEEKLSCNRPWLEGTAEAVASLDGRYTVDGSTFQTGELIEYFPGVERLKTPCNLQVEQYYQPFIANTVRLQIGFGLDEHQVASVVLAMAQSAWL